MPYPTTRQGRQVPVESCEPIKNRSSVVPGLGWRRSLAIWLKYLPSTVPVAGSRPRKAVATDFKSQRLSYTASRPRP